MTSFDWSVLTTGLAAGLGVGLFAITAVRRRRTRRRAEYAAQVGSESGRRRIEVVAINDANPEPDGRTIERK